MVQLRFTKPVITRVLCYLWVALLACSFYITTRYSRHESLRTEEYAYACDPFGYLRMAKQIREAFARRDWPEFKLETKQTRALISFMQEKQVPLSRWEEVVAPHAHHYFPRAQYVGVQYPPGTALALALFAPGEAVYSLNNLVVSVLTIFGVVALVSAVWKRAWRSIALVVLTLSLTLFVLARIGSASFSINVVLIPVLLTCLFAVAALWFENSRHDRLAALCAFLAGLSLGVATVVRLPSLILLPGLIVLVWPGLRRLLRWTSLPIALVLGTIVTGIIPVVINQTDVAGAWYLSTYASVDTALPTLERFRFNLSYFLGRGPAAVDNWALFYAVAGFAGFVLLYLKRDNANENEQGPQVSWRRFALAAGVIWFLSLAYFLTHKIVAAHYMVPSVLAAVALLAFGAFSLELRNKSRFDPRRLMSWVALVLILSPGAVVAKRAWRLRSQPHDPVTASTHTPILLPAELADDKAWIWADFLTGTLWYYANKPAFKIHFTDDATRAMLFRFVFERGERQYLIQDSVDMPKYMAQIERMGGKLEMRGKIDGNPYFLVVWPSEGPR